MRAQHTDHQEGKHTHSLQKIETSREAMLERFGAYIDHFGVRVE